MIKENAICRSLSGLSKMVFNAFYEHDYHAGLANLNSPHFTYNQKSIHHYCHILLNKKTRNFKQTLTKETSVYATNLATSSPKINSKTSKINAV